MSNKIWPVLHGLSWDLKRKPAFKTAIQPAVANAMETRLQIGGPDPALGFELSYEILFSGSGPAGQGKDELSQLEAFFWARGGSFDSFLIDAGAITKNPAESFVTDQTLIVDANNNAPLVRTKPGSQYSETIYELGLDDSGNPLAPIIKHNDGVLVAGTDYALYTPAQVRTGALNANGITYAGWVVHFLTSMTARVSADFSWLYRVRFAEDTQEYEMWHYLFWKCQQIQLVGTRV